MVRAGAAEAVEGIDFGVKEQVANGFDLAQLRGERRQAAGGK